LLDVPSSNRLVINGSKFFSEDIYATLNFISTISDTASADSCVNNIRDCYRKYPCFVYMFKQLEGGKVKVISVLLTAADLEAVVPTVMSNIRYESEAQPNGVEGILVAANGAPLLPLYKNDSLGLTGPTFTDAYMDRHQQFMDLGGCEHLAQILLLAGDFEMILRYESIRKSLAERVSRKHLAFVRFMSDCKNYWPARKIIELRATKFEITLLGNVLGDEYSEAEALEEMKRIVEEDE